MYYKVLIALITSFGISIAYSQEVNSSFNQSIDSTVLVQDLHLNKTAPPELFELKSLTLKEFSSNQAWLNRSIYDLSIWKTEQKFLGMRLCEPIEFEWEMWGDNKYSNLRRQIRDMEYQIFLSKGY